MAITKFSDTRNAKIAHTIAIPTPIKSPAPMKNLRPSFSDFFICFLFELYVLIH